MHEILPKLLWIGHALDARSARALFDAGIGAVVDLAYEEAPARLPRETVYCRFPIIDGGGNEASLLRAAVETIVSLLDAGTPTLVACGAGMSRPSIMAAVALSIFRDEAPERSLESLVQAGPHDISATLWDEVMRACGKTHRGT